MNLAGQGIPLIVAAVSIPIVLSRLGQARFGFLSLVWVILGYSAVFDVGLSRAATQFIAEEGAHGRVDAQGTIFWTTAWTQAAFGLGGALFLWAGAAILEQHLLKVPPSLVAEVRTSSWLVALAVPALLVSGSCRAVLEARQRFDVLNAVRLPTNTLFYALPALGAVFGLNLAGVVALLVACRYAGLFGYATMALRELPRPERRPRFDGALLSSLLAFGTWVTVSDVISPLLTYLDRFLLASLVSLAAAGLYAAPFELVTRLSVVPMSVAAALFPTFSSLNAYDDTGNSARMLWRASKYVILVVGSISALVIALSHDVLNWWLGSESAEKCTAALGILAVGIVLNASAYVPTALIHGRGRPDLTAKFHLAELPLYVLFLWVAVHKWGILGAAISWTFRVSLDAILLYVAAWTVVDGRSPSVHLKGTVRAMAVVCGLWIAGLGVHRFVQPAWLQAVAMGVVLCGTTMLAFAVVLERDERTEIAGFLSLVGVSKRAEC